MVKQRKNKKNESTVVIEDVTASQEQEQEPTLTSFQPESAEEPELVEEPEKIHKTDTQELMDSIFEEEPKKKEEKEAPPTLFKPTNAHLPLEFVAFNIVTKERELFKADSLFYKHVFDPKIHKKRKDSLRYYFSGIFAHGNKGSRPLKQDVAREYIRQYPDLPVTEIPYSPPRIKNKMKRINKKHATEQKQYLNKLLRNGIPVDLRRHLHDIPDLPGDSDDQLLLDQKLAKLQRKAERMVTRQKGYYGLPSYGGGNQNVFWN